MTQITKFYASQLAPLLKLNLSKLGKPVPADPVLDAIAIKIVEDLESKRVPLKSSALSYAAFYYANVVAPAAAPATEAQPELKNVGLQMETQRQALIVADLVPIARASLAARHGDATGLDGRAVEIASKLAAQLDSLLD
jgi:hypothetical protein